MDFLQDTVSDLNWIAILLAVLSTMPVGYVWYDLKIGFGKKWSKLVGITEKEMNSTDGMAKTFGSMLVTSLFTAIILGSLLLATKTEGVVDSLLFGIIVGFVFRGGAHFIHNGFAKKADELSFIDAGHDMVSIAVMSAILGLF